MIFIFDRPLTPDQFGQATWAGQCRGQAGNARHRDARQWLPGQVIDAEKGAFVEEGRMRETFRRDRKWHDKIIIGLLEDELR